MIDPTTGEVLEEEALPPHVIPFVRSANNYDTNLVSDQSALRCLDPSMAKQSEAEDADINTIVKRFGLTGELPKDVAIPAYGDFSNEVTDYHTALSLVREAAEGFMELPAHVRKEFDNDPGKFVDFVSDEKNREKAEALGIVPRKATERPVGSLAPSSEGGSSTPPLSTPPEGSKSAQAAAPGSGATSSPT